MGKRRIVISQKIQGIVLKLLTQRNLLLVWEVAICIRKHQKDRNKKNSSSRMEFMIVVSIIMRTKRTKRIIARIGMIWILNSSMIRKISKATGRIRIVMKMHLSWSLMKMKIEEQKEKDIYFKISTKVFLYRWCLLPCYFMLSSLKG